MLSTAALHSTPSTVNCVTGTDNNDTSGLLQFVKQNLTKPKDICRSGRNCFYRRSRSRSSYYSSASSRSRTRSRSRSRNRSRSRSRDSYRNRRRGRRRRYRRSSSYSSSSYSRSSSRRRRSSRSSSESASPRRRRRRSKSSSASPVLSLFERPKAKVKSLEDKSPPKAFSPAPTEEVMKVDEKSPSHKASPSPVSVTSPTSCLQVDKDPDVNIQNGNDEVKNVKISTLGETVVKNVKIPTDSETIECGSKTSTKTSEDQNTMESNNAKEDESTDMIQCQFCLNSNSIRSLEYQQHLVANHKEQLFQCTLCDDDEELDQSKISFPTFDEAKQHVEVEHQVTEVNGVKAVIRIPSLENLRKYKCILCSKIFIGMIEQAVLDSGHYFEVHKTKKANPKKLKRFCRLCEFGAAKTDSELIQHILKDHPRCDYAEEDSEESNMETGPDEEMNTKSNEETYEQLSTTAEEQKIEAEIMHEIRKPKNTVLPIENEIAKKRNMVQTGHTNLACDKTEVTKDKQIDFFNMIRSKKLEKKPKMKSCELQNNVGSFAENQTKNVDIKKETKPREYEEILTDTEQSSKDSKIPLLMDFCDTCQIPLNENTAVDHFMSKTHKVKIKLKKRCLLCSKYMDSLNVHLESSHPDNMFICLKSSCNRAKFIDLNKFKKHWLEKHSNEKHLSSDNLIKKRILGIPSNLSSYQCRLCNRLFLGTKFEKIKQHQRWEDGMAVFCEDNIIFSCRVCNKNFISDSSLQKHCKTHFDSESQRSRSSSDSSSDEDERRHYRSKSKSYSSRSSEERYRRRARNSFPQRNESSSDSDESDYHRRRSRSTYAKYLDERSRSNRSRSPRSRSSRSDRSRSYNSDRSYYESSRRSYYRSASKSPNRTRSPTPRLEKNKRPNYIRCLVCPQVMEDTEKDRSQHYKGCHNIQLFKCEKCREEGKMFSHINRLKVFEHLRKFHLNVEDNKSELLKYFTKIPSDLRRIYCKICAKNESSYDWLCQSIDDVQQELQEHKREYHDYKMSHEEVFGLGCRGCEYIFDWTDHNEWSTHVDTDHSSDDKSSFCPFGCKNMQESLKSHDAKHHREKCFSCRLCNDSQAIFRDYRDLTIHVSSMHKSNSVSEACVFPRDLRSITCMLCQKMFFAVGEREMKKHLENEHQEMNSADGFLSWMCRICMKTEEFEDEEELKEHLVKQHKQFLL